MSNRKSILITSVTPLGVESKSGATAQDAWNRCAVQLVETAICHCEYFMLDKFIQNVNACSGKKECIQLDSKYITSYAYFL